MIASETKLIELKEIIMEKRQGAFNEAFPSTRDELRKRMLAMVNAYDVCLIEIDRLLNENRGEILKGINVGS